MTLFKTAEETEKFHERFTLVEHTLMSFTRTEPSERKTNNYLLPTINSIIA